MKTSTPLALVLASFTLFTLSSCIWQKDEFADIGKGYTPSYEDDEFYYYNGGDEPSFLHGSIGLTFGYSYYHGPRYLCPLCHSNPCTGHSGRASSWAHHDHDGSHRSSGGGSSGPLYTHKSGGLNGGASDAHPKEWFTSRGYAPSRLEKTDDHGHSTKRNDHDADDHRTSGSLKSHSLSPSFVDRVKNEVHSSSGNGGSSNFNLGVGGHSTSSSSDRGSSDHSSSSSKKDDDSSSGKKH